MHITTMVVKLLSKLLQFQAGKMSELFIKKQTRENSEIKKWVWNFALIGPRKRFTGNSNYL